MADEDPNETFDSKNQSILEAEQKRLINLLKDANSEKNAGNKITEEQRILLTKLNDVQQKLINNYSEINDKNIKTLKSLEEQKKYIDQIVVAQQNVSTAVEHTSNILKTLTGIDSSWEKTPLGSILTAMGQGGAVDKDFFGEIKKNLNAVNIIGMVTHSVTSKIIESTIAVNLALNEQISSFAQLTGLVGHYNDAIIESYNSSLVYGRSIEDVTTNLKSLLNETTIFRNLASSEQTNLINLTTKMTNLGLEISTATSLIEAMTTQMGMPLVQAEDRLLDLAAIAIKNKISFAEFSSEVAQAQKRLAAFGSDSIRMAANLVTLSKRTGIAANTFLDFSESVQTFEGASDKASIINSLFFGNIVDSTTLLQKSFEGEGKALEYVIDNMRRAGHTFQNMSVPMRTVLAKNLNISMDEFAKGWSNGAKSVEEFAEEAEKAKLDDFMKKSVSFFTALKSLAASFAVVVTPVLESLTTIIQGITSFITWLPSWGKSLVLFVIAIGGAGITIGMASKKIKTVITIINTLPKTLNAVSTAANTLGPDLKKIADGVGSIGSGAGAAAPPIGSLNNRLKDAGQGAKLAKPHFWQLGVVLLFAGAGIGLAAWGLSELAKSFSLLGDSAWAFTATVAIIVAGMAALTYLGAPAAGVVLLLSAAFLVLGGAMVVISLAISNVLEKLTKLLSINIAADLGKQLNEVGKGLEVIIDATVKGSPAKIQRVTNLIREVNLIQRTQRSSDNNNSVQKSMNITLKAPIEVKIGNETIQKIVKTIMNDNLELAAAEI